MRVASDGELRCLVIVTKLTQFYPQNVAIIQGMIFFGGKKLSSASLQKISSVF